jgi:hypothetical protein
LEDIMTINRSTKIGGGLPPYWGEPLKFTGYTTDLFYPASLAPVSMAGGATVGSGTVYYVPFIPRFTHTFQKMAIYNTGAGDNGNQINMSIYESSGVIPNDRLFAAISVTLGGAAALNEATIAGGQELVARTLYYLALELDTGSDIQVVYSDIGSDSEVSGFPTLLHNGFTSLRVPAIYSDFYVETAAALPATATPETPGAVAPNILLKG